jgi:hypothetical protein
VKPHSIKPVIVTSALLTLIASPFEVHAGDRGTVIAVYPPEYTAAFKAARHLTTSVAGDGRFAIVRIASSIVYGEASYALIYVPADVPVAENSVVELRGRGDNTLVQVGAATVDHATETGPLALGEK